MKKIFIILTVLLAAVLNAQNIWLNELHYDNAGTDEGEFIEIVLENAASYELADFTISLYNGYNQTVYDSVELDQFLIGDTVDDYSIYYYIFPSNGIQNGSPDGVAIDYQGDLITGQFLSYEGEFEALDGPALGLVSTDIGVEEESGTPVGESLQLQGIGGSYADFAWEGPLTESPGSENPNQTIGEITEPTITVLSPNGGEEWEQGSTHDILWSSLNFTDNVKIELSLVWNGPREILINSTENDGNWTWEIPEDQEVSDYYAVIISDAIDGDPWDDSNSAFSIIPPPSVIDVATIAELRAGIQGEQIYRLTGEAILTYQQDFRNQKFIQDDTAGIMIDDDPGVINTEYEIWDGIINLTGTLTEYGGMIEFQPTTDDGIINSNGNEIDPEIVTLAEFNADFESYESELIKIENSTFLDAGVFEAGQVYPISDGSRDEANFRTTFYDADYIGTNIPSIPVHLTVICNSRSDGNYLTSRWLDDIVPAGTEETITVVVPNGGEQWYQGTNQNITWSTYNFTGNLDIELLQNGTNPVYLVEDTEDDGIWEWPIPIDLEPGDNYSIRISDADDGDPTDESDNYFSILEEVPQPVEGDVIISEIMQNPSTVSDENGEWFELYNTTESPIDINGWVIMDLDNDEFTINNGDPLFIDTMDYLVLGNNSDQATNGGLMVDYEYSDFFLGNSVDEVIIYWVDGSTEIDRVEYDDGITFPDPNGSSMALDPTLLNYNDNDLGANWYPSYLPYGDGDNGTPGEENSDLLFPPVEAVNPDPENEAVDVSINPQLTWENGEWTETIDLYFGTDDPPTTMVLDNVSAVESYDTGTLNYETTYYWQVVCRNPAGETESEIWSFTTEIEFDQDDNLIPSISGLKGNYPNPFNPITTIEYALSADTKVRLEIYNLQGELVRTLLDSDLPAGYHSTTWNGIDNNSLPVSSGIYLYRLKAGAIVQTKKMLLIK